MRNPFEDICKADDLKNENIKDIFEKNKIWDKILQPLNHIIIGSRGSGKSMLLKKLSASSMTKEDFPEEYKFFGIYIHISHITRGFNDIFNSIQRSFNDDGIFWNKKLIMTRWIYSQYVCIHLMKRFCEEIEDSSISFYPWNNPDKKQKMADDIGNLIGLKAKKGLQEIIEKINKQIIQIDTFLAGEWLISNEFKIDNRLNIHTLPEMISNIIYENTNKLNEKMYVYFLLDTSEYVHPECQKVSNSFFERGLSFRTKLAERPYHLNNLETLSGRNIKSGTEFIVLFLDYLLNDKENSKIFLKKTFKKHLEYIKKNYEQYSNIACDPAEFLEIKKDEFDRIFSIFSIVSIRDFINFLATAWNMLITKKGGNILELENITLSHDYIEIALKNFAKVQFEQISQVEPLDKSFDSTRSYSWEKVKGFYSFLISYLKSLIKEKKKMDLLTFKITDLFISEDIQTILLKPAFAEGIFRFCSEENIYLLSVPNEFYLDPLYLNAPKVELYEYGKGTYKLETSEEEIRKSLKIPFGKKQEKKEELPERYTAFLSCSFEKDPLPKENRDSIKKAFKSVKIDVYDAEDCGITFQTVGIADKIKEFDFFIIELSRQTPNIMFENGIAAAFEKFPAPLVNEENESALSDVIKPANPISVRTYNFESLKEKAAQVRKAIEDRINTVGKLYEPLYNKTDVRSLKPNIKKDIKDKTIYISYAESHSSLWEKALDKIKKYFKEYTVITDQNSGLVSFEATLWQVPIYCISQSKFCIVDTSGEKKPDLFQSYILGLSFGLRKRTIRIEEKKLAKKEEISLWSSYPYGTWTDINNLIDEISKFIGKYKKR